MKFLLWQNWHNSLMLSTAAVVKSLELNFGGHAIPSTVNCSQTLLLMSDVNLKRRSYETHIPKLKNVRIIKIYIACCSMDFH